MILSQASHFVMGDLMCVLVGLFEMVTFGAIDTQMNKTFTGCF